MDAPSLCSHHAALQQYSEIVRLRHHSLGVLGEGWRRPLAITYNRGR
jgi:hypothetical protein